MASANLDILVSVGGLVYELESAANKNGATIYNICHRNAGWAIQWHEEKKQGNSDNWKDGLVIYRYYNTLEEMVKGEFVRLGESPTKRALDGAYCSCENPDIYINRVCQLCGKPHAPRQ